LYGGGLSIGGAVHIIPKTSPEGLVFLIHAVSDKGKILSS
jgi:hypothetical protein